MTTRSARPSRPVLAALLAAGLAVLWSTAAAAACGPDGSISENLHPVQPPSAGTGSTPTTPTTPSTPTTPTTPGTPSTPPTSTPPDTLPRYITHGSRARKWIAFTFDADMKGYMWRSRDTTDWKDPRIVQLLRDTDTPATIFLNGLFVKAYPAFVQDMATDEDLEFGNHTWDHLGWTDPCFAIDSVHSQTAKKLELTRTEDIVRAKTGRELRWFRFPAGCHTSNDLRLVRKLGETSIGWDTYLGDALGWSVSHMVRYAKQVARNGSIMVMHLNGAPYHPGTYEAIKKLIPWFKDHGWRFVTVSQMLGVDAAAAGDAALPAVNDVASAAEHLPALLASGSPTVRRGPLAV